MSDELICSVLLGTLFVYQDHRIKKLGRDVFTQLSEIWTFQQMIVDTLDKLAKRTKE